MLAGFAWLNAIGDFKGVGHFEAKYQVEGLPFALISTLRFAPVSIDR